MTVAAAVVSERKAALADGSASERCLSLPAALSRTQRATPKAHGHTPHAPKIHIGTGTAPSREKRRGKASS